MRIPLDKKLYDKVKAQAKVKFLSYPSAYASSWIVRTYKSLGGEYINIGKKNMSDLERWFAEKWIDVCALPKKVPCGRKNAGKKNYPYCRPTIRVNKNTPKTVDEIPLKKLKERCKAKRKNPSKKIRC